MDYHVHKLFFGPFQVLSGATAALALMTIISVAIGRIFQAVPTQLKTSYICCTSCYSCCLRNVGFCVCIYFLG
jgi:putative Ca2+/H+ antiporter (TMEM165/GDT1 family)